MAVVLDILLTHVIYASLVLQVVCAICHQGRGRGRDCPGCSTAVQEEKFRILQIFLISSWLICVCVYVCLIIYKINYYSNRRRKIIEIHIVEVGVHAQNMLLMEYTPKSERTADLYWISYVSNCRICLFI